MSESTHKSLYYPNQEIKYGFHIVKKATLVKSITLKLDTPMTAYQIYVANRSKRVLKSNMADVMETRELLQIHNKYLAIHACLLYNLAGCPRHKKDPNFLRALETTCAALTSELDIGAALGAGGVVVHIGSCIDTEKGISTIAYSIKNCLKRDTAAAKLFAKRLKISLDEFKKQRMILLENSAGEGSKLGKNLEEIGAIIKQVPDRFKSQVGVCIDTAHAFGAGLYDWGKPSEVIRFYEDFDRIVGLKFLKLFHLNDSRCSDQKAHNAPFNSKKDRHENLGLGYIFGDGVGDPTETSRMDGLKEFFKQAIDHHIPIIGEPPAKSRDLSSAGPGGKQDWAVVRGLLSDSPHPLATVAKSKM